MAEAVVKGVAAVAVVVGSGRRCWPWHWGPTLTKPIWVSHADHSGDKAQTRDLAI